MKNKLINRTDNLQDLVISICKIAEQAGDAILQVYNTDFTVNHKEDKSPLTDADTASHNIISSNLAELTPNIPVLSEESVDIPFKDRQKWDQYWLIDPLDGTREFIKKNGEFTVNIALIKNHQPILGVVFVPVKNIIYYAAKNHGAFKQIRGKNSEKIISRKMNPDFISIAGSRSHGTRTQQDFINQFSNVDLIAIGSSLKFCLVAEGKVDIYPRFGPTSEWDTAAAQCIVEESNGIVTDLELRKLEYNTKVSLINPDFLVIADPSYDWKQFLP